MRAAAAGELMDPAALARILVSLSSSESQFSARLSTTNRLVLVNHFRNWVKDLSSIEQKVFDKIGSYKCSRHRGDKKSSNSARI